ncbi:MAG: Antitoxin Xre/MbcA/ParS C-terminal toxin-binding domain [Thermoanaerobaculia bacterium]|nr:Antitoxin Xre/MbcA/ParS C-terminal toxin-binding domain [Thermoanaerobaculia bacterium]
MQRKQRRRSGSERAIAQPTREGGHDPRTIASHMSVTIQERPKTAEENALDSELAATFTSEGATGRWLKTPNPILNGDLPIECMKRREYDRVRAALEAFNTGVYV